MSKEVYRKYSNQVYDILKAIPYGKVTTFPHIALKLGNINLTMVVGNIIHKNKKPLEYPCFKVVNADGYLSKIYVYGGMEGQKKFLEKEGIEVIDNKVDLSKYFSD
jgi:methylated-DNA-protein-cysteine methyltransferase-like protein